MSDLKTTNAAAGIPADESMIRRSGNRSRAALDKTASTET
jgi:hypothetical protein